MTFQGAKYIWLLVLGLTSSSVIGLALGAVTALWVTDILAPGSVTAGFDVRGRSTLVTSAPVASAPVAASGQTATAPITSIGSQTAAPSAGAAGAGAHATPIPPAAIASAPPAPPPPAAAPSATAAAAPAALTPVAQGPVAQGDAAPADTAQGDAAQGDASEDVASAAEFPTLSYNLQFGAFRNAKNAEVLLRRLSAAGVAAKMAAKTDSAGGAWTVVRLEGFDTLAAASAKAAELRRTLGVDGIVQFGQSGGQGAS